MPQTRRARAIDQRNPILAQAELLIWGRPVKTKDATAAQSNDTLIAKWMKHRGISEVDLLHTLRTGDVTPQDLLDELNLAGHWGEARNRLKRGEEVEEGRIITEMQEQCHRELAQTRSRLKEPIVVGEDIESLESQLQKAAKKQCAAKGPHLESAARLPAVEGEEHGA